jgi:hypothetical protein
MTKDFASEREGPAVSGAGDSDDRLGARLRAMFQEIVTEPLPERFRHLLQGFTDKGRCVDAEQSNDKR